MSSPLQAGRGPLCWRTRLDANKQSLAYVCGRADARDAEIAKGLTLDEARRIASNIAKLPNLLAKKG